MNCCPLDRGQGWNSKAGSVGVEVVEVVGIVEGVLEGVVLGGGVVGVGETVVEVLGTTTGVLVVEPGGRTPEFILYAESWPPIDNVSVMLDLR